MAYITIIYERAVRRGEVWSEVPFILPGWECEWLRVFKGSITGGVLKSLKGTILEGKDKNFPEELLDLIGFFRLLRLSLRAP